MHTYRILSGNVTSLFVRDCHVCAQWMQSETDFVIYSVHNMILSTTTLPWSLFFIGSIFKMEVEQVFYNFHLEFGQLGFLLDRWAWSFPNMLCTIIPISPGM